MSPQIPFPRHSGRTTRMLLSAINEAIKGANVTVVTSEAVARQMDRILQNAGYPTLLGVSQTKFGDGSITLKIYDPRELDLVSMAPHVAGMGIIDDPLYVDHNVIEDAFPRLTEMLYKFMADPQRDRGEWLESSSVEVVIEALANGEVSEGWAANKLGIDRLGVRQLLSDFKRITNYHDEE